jgi:hypothetical protein
MIGTGFGVVEHALCRGDAVRWRAGWAVPGVEVIRFNREVIHQVGLTHEPVKVAAAAVGSLLECSILQR